jgi:hypothetical protein
MSTDNENEAVIGYYSKCEILSCAGCCEAKILGNKYYNQLNNTSKRIWECAELIDQNNVEQSIPNIVPN